MRKLETLGRPVVAAMTGTALGGGLEIGLYATAGSASTPRASSTAPPEVTLGLLPGGGGVTHITRMLGIANEVERPGPGPAAQTGQGLRAGDRRRAERGPGRGAAEGQRVVRRARRCSPGTSQYRSPAGRRQGRSLASILPAFPANLRKQLKGAPDARAASLSHRSRRGYQVDPFDTALRIGGPLLRRAGLAGLERT
ncbi:hypothetical protein HBB16_17805 [Pseudonocardia sp. MCCB 268]|nr:hypothetical protein [Pseudonocardia cytotoxica]